MASSSTPPSDLQLDHAAARLWPLVHERLRRLASRCGVPEGDVLHQTTDIVHAAFERLARERTVWQNTAHFMAIAACHMRRVVASWARRVVQERRHLSTTAAVSAPEPVADGCDPAELLALDEALEELHLRHARAAQVVDLRFFAGLGFAEIARALDVSLSTAEHDWTFARAWLHKRLRP
jgi:RNA polymerase sigma factor (TIGR02999 family)